MNQLCLKNLIWYHFKICDKLCNIPLVRESPHWPGVTSICERLSRLNRMKILSMDIMGCFIWLWNKLNNTEFKKILFHRLSEIPLILVKSKIMYVLKSSAKCQLKIISYTLISKIILWLLKITKDFEESRDSSHARLRTKQSTTIP